ncbi:unnamed protein product [Discosporangium mesarthrocarpum]
MIHLDAEQAFIQADIDAEVYVRLPLGCGALTNTIVRLNRALYGCKQSSRAWNIHLTSTLKSFGFDQSKADSCLLRFLDGNETTLLIASHVEDMIAVGSRQNCDDFRWNFPQTTWDPSVGILDVLLKEIARVEHLTFHRLLTLINCVSVLMCPSLVLCLLLPINQFFQDRKMNHKDLISRTHWVLAMACEHDSA